MGHKSRLKSDGGVAHLAFDFGSGDKRGDRVDHDGVDRAGAHEHVADFERLLACVGLGDEHLVDVDPKARGIHRVERMLGVDEGDHTAHRLGFGENLKGKGCLTRGFRAVDLDDAPARDASDSECGVERQGPGGNDADVEVLAPLAKLHDRSPTEFLLDLIGCDLEHLGFFVVHSFSSDYGDFVHVIAPHYTNKRL